MPILRTITDKLLVRLLKHDVYENRFLRRYFKRHYGIDIGLYSMGFFDRWRVPPGTVVGRYCSMAASARLINANHPMNALSTHPYFYLREFGIVEKDRVESVSQLVEDDVWIGHGATITPGCKTVGRGSVIGAGAIVTRDVPRYAVMTGCPAKVVRYRFSPEVTEAIEATQWWLLDTADLKHGLNVAAGFLLSPSVDSSHEFSSAIQSLRESHSGV